jgi:ribosomal protein L7/L12
MGAARGQRKFSQAISAGDSARRKSSRRHRPGSTFDPRNPMTVKSRRLNLVSAMRSRAVELEGVGGSAKPDVAQLLRDGAAEIELLKGKFKDLAESIAEGHAGKILAIVAYRMATGASLPDARDWVEARSGCPSVKVTLH